MTSRPLRIQSFLSLLLSAAIVLGGLAIPVYPQKQAEVVPEKPVVITFGQPNIWSLEQAHYLLARMHRQNLDLQTAALGDLDPNATNASRIDILKTLIEAGVKFDQAVALNNQLLKNDKAFNSQRRQELLAKRSALQEESTQLARDIAALKIAKAATKTDTDAAPIQAQIDAKTEEKAAVDNQLTQTNTEVEGLTSASGNFTSVEAPGSFNSDSLKGDLDSLINKVQLINPSIAATLRLDNHIQMQYEIIAKQLTLLRDEVGSGERLVFLELPQSVNATQDKAEDKVAQVWWRIAGYTRVDKEKMLEHEQRDLGQKIAEMKIIRAENQKLSLKYVENKNDLTTQLDKLCAKKAEAELEVEKTQKLIEQAQKANREADEKLANAKKAKAECDEKLAAAQKAVDDKTQKLTTARTRAQMRAANRRVQQALSEAMRVAGECSAANEALRLAEKTKAVAVNASLCEPLAQTLEQLQASIKQFESSIAETREAIQRVDSREVNLQKETAKVLQAYTSLSTKYEKLTLEIIKKRIAHQRDRADRLLQGGGANTSEIVDKTLDLLDTKFGLKKAEYGNQKTDDDGRKYALDESGANDEGRQYVNLDRTAAAGRSQDQSRTDKTGQATLRNRSIRTIDIIPRQNALNINDTKQRVSKTGIFAAFSFLFGFAGKFNYERQHEQAQQFLNQELFTSGFGKGDTDFGWNFYPFGGTKQLAPGIRTTYAVAVIPEDAETLVLKAKGCYFPRKQNQPLNYDLAGGTKWTGDAKSKSSNCSEEEQVFVIPVPGGSGDGADYYVTGMRFSPNRKQGDRMVASIYGQNFPTQIGVLINGVPLTESIGLGQLGIESILADKVRENCVGQVCGRFERIDANQIVISFSMPADFKNTPQIALIGPGKEIELNKLNLTINGDDDQQLDSAAWMFGKPTKPPSRTIADFKVAPSPTGMTGVLSGGDFNPDDTIYVNGVEAKPAGVVCKRLDLCIVSFPAQATDSLTVTVSPKDKAEEAVSRTFVNPSNLSIMSASVVSNTAGDATHQPVLTVKLDGSGFKSALEVRIVKADGSLEEPQKIVPSAGQMILKVVSPEPVIQITLRDPDNNKVVSTVVVKP